MLHHDTHVRARSLRTLPLEELGRHALLHQLIDAFETFDDRVLITQGHNRFVLPHRQAVTFLIGLLQGRGWPGPAASHSASRRELESDRAMGRWLDSSAPVPDPTTIDQLSPSALETTLRMLLTFTREVGIIEGYSFDEDVGSVRIEIKACSTELSYADAVAYLFDCIQFEMRSLKQLRNTPGRSPAPLANEQ